MTREHGFLYSAPMALVNIRGDKTNTRRGITRHRSVDVWTGKMPTKQLWELLDWSNAWPLPEHVCGYRNVLSVGSKIPGGGYTALACRVRKGDRIWQRETWGVQHEHADQISDRDQLADAERGVPWAGVVYRATTPYALELSPWRSPLHMPRWASRFVAEVVTDPWPQRIGDITDEQCLAEGVEEMLGKQIDGTVNGEPSKLVCFDPRVAFGWLWRSINGNWDPDAWVWVYEYQRCEQP